MLIPGHDPAAVCARMKEICFERGAEDNLTAVIVSFPGGAEQAADDDLIDEVTIAGVRLTDTESALGQTISPEVEDPEVWDEGARPTAVTGDAADANEEPVMERPRDVNAHLNQESSTDYPDEATAEADYAPSGRIPDDSDENTADPIPVKHAEAHPSYSYVNAEPSRGPGRVIGWLIAGLIIGLAAGLGTSYFVVQKNLPAVPAPVLYEQKSNNVPLTSFEETRRLVDADPIKYLNANAVTPQEADDYFWLGRALLLTGKPVEARRAFEEAKRRLPGVAEPSNVKTMSNEIAMALIIAANPASAEAFAKEVAAGTSLAADANVNANAVGPIR